MSVTESAGTESIIAGYEQRMALIHWWSEPRAAERSVVALISHMHDIRDGSPNAFYAAFDRLWKLLQHLEGPADGAAAPDLLASCREFVALYDGLRDAIGPSVREKLARADAAIAKAEGQS